MKSAMLDDYEVYISEDMIYISEDMDIEGDPISLDEAMRSPNSPKWLMAIEDEIRSVSIN
jgi:hypothetical protein